MLLQKPRTFQGLGFTRFQGPVGTMGVTVFKMSTLKFLGIV